MNRIADTTAVVAMIVLIFHGFVPTAAQTEATIEGVVETPCDPSRRTEIASVRIRPVSGGSATTVAVDPSTGAFRSSALTASEHELTAIGVDGKPLSVEPTRLPLSEGPNRVLLSLQPPECGEQEEGGGKTGLKNWQLTLIYFGAIGAVILVVSDDEEPASPF